MLKIQSGYTTYFNLKQKRTGVLFQGAFKAHQITNDNSLDKVFGYVNKNYTVHTIPKNKMNFVYASDFEYENSKFKLVDPKEGRAFIEKYGGAKGLKKHCEEIVDMIREERGKPTLQEEEELPE